MENLEQLKYPIGRFTAPEDIDSSQLKAWIKEMESFPSKLGEATFGLNDDQLNLTYRPEGWTIRQVVHHLADSHANAYIRVKLTLTEENPTVRPYFEERWGETPDAKTGKVSYSLALLEGLHHRLAATFKFMGMDGFNRTYFHPEHQRSFDLKHLLGTYAWHGAHHLAQINNALKFQGRF